MVSTRSNVQWMKLYNLLHVCTSIVLGQQIHMRKAKKLLRIVVIGAIATHCQENSASIPTSCLYANVVLRLIQKMNVMLLTH